MSKEEWAVFQENLLADIEKLCGNQNKVEVLAKVLNQSKATIYKKIGLQTKFGLDELISLANHFQISLDMYLTHKSTPIPFQSDAIRKMPEKTIDYLHNLQKHLSFITQLSNVSYINLASEVPIFHYMTFKKLFAFKLFVWNFSSWSNQGLEKNLDLSKYLNDSLLIEAMEKCAHTYYHFSGVEIWNFRMLDITIDQIKYFIPMKVFQSKMAVFEILVELEEFIYHLEKICTTGTKRFETKDALNKSNLKVYMNEILNSNEVILVTSDDGDTVYSTIDTPNFIRTSEKRMTHHTKTWLKNTIRHSTQISGEGEKDRRIMFEKIHNKFEKAKSEIKSLLDYIYS